MRTQATRCTREELTELALRRSRGYLSKRAERPPRLGPFRPILDALIGGAVLAIGVGGMLAMWVKMGAGL